MLKTFFKGVFSLIVAFIFTILSVFFIKGLIETNKRLNEEGHRLPTTFFKTWGKCLKEALWEEELFY